MIAVRVYGRPASQGSKRLLGNGAMVESSKHLPTWRHDVTSAARDALGDVPPIEGPVRVTLTFSFDKPQSAPKRKRTWPITRSSGDVDKLARAVLDALTSAGVWRDDSQVIELFVRKSFVNDKDDSLGRSGALIMIIPIHDEGIG